MSSRRAIGFEPSVEVAATEQTADGFVAIDEVAERERALRPDVEREIQATVDYADERAHGGRLFGQTLEAQERMDAREREIERTRVRWDRRADSDREARCRRTLGRVARERRSEFEKRAASVDPWLAPKRSDPREELSRVELATVNREAARLAGRLDGWTPAAVARRLAERVADGADVTRAVLDVYEALRTAPGQVIPIEAVGSVRRQEVSVTGEILTLWEPSHPRIAQVGLLGDETGRIKFTIWVRSDQPMVTEGERVTIRDAAKSWYRGRCSIALTGRSVLLLPEENRLSSSAMAD